MTPRQARTERRTAERKAKKAELRRNKDACLSRPDHSPYPSTGREGGPSNPGFVPQSTALAAALQEPDFVPLHTPTPEELASFDKLKAQRKAETNRRNAEHSTGPRTASGKLASSGNSLKHGLASGRLIIPGEDPSEFEALLASLVDEHQPVGATEQLLVNEMAQSYWLSQRALRLQNECFTDEGVDDKRLSLYMRYHTTHERAFHKALTTLMKLKKEQARGFVSQNAKRIVAKSGFVSQTVAESPKPTPESEFVPQKEHAEAA